MTVGAALATPANALHFAVENGVFLLQEIIRIFLSFLRGHLIGAWLAMTNRGLRNCRICCARDPAPLVCAIASVLPIKSVSAIVAINFVPSILSAPMTDRLFLVEMQKFSAKRIPS
jgi:hypothetical protein